MPSIAATLGISSIAPIKAASQINNSTPRRNSYPRSHVWTARDPEPTPIRPRIASQSRWVSSWGWVSVQTK